MHETTINESGTHRSDCAHSAGNCTVHACALRNIRCSAVRVKVRMDIWSRRLPVRVWDRVVCVCVRACNSCHLCVSPSVRLSLAPRAAAANYYAHVMLRNMHAHSCASMCVCVCVCSPITGHGRHTCQHMLGGYVNSGHHLPPSLHAAVAYLTNVGAHACI